MKYISIVIIVMFLNLIYAQGIKILEQGGKQASNLKETTVIFETEDNLNVDVFHLLNESTAFASGPGGTASGYGVTTQFLCTAPAKLVIQPGVYNLRVDQNAMLGENFRITAEGGTQYWKVKNSSFGKFLTGDILFFGGIFVGFFVSMAAGAPEVGGPVGTAMVGTGIWLIYTSQADADFLRCEK